MDRGNVLGRWLRESDESDDFMVIDVDFYDEVTDELCYRHLGNDKRITAKAIDEGILVRPDSVVADPYKDIALLKGIAKQDEDGVALSGVSTENVPREVITSPAPTPEFLISEIPENMLILTAIERLREKKTTSDIFFRLNMSFDFNVESLVQGCEFLGIDREETIKTAITQKLKNFTMDDIVKMLCDAAE